MRLPPTVTVPLVLTSSGLSSSGLASGGGAKAAGTAAGLGGASPAIEWAQESRIGATRSHVGARIAATFSRGDQRLQPGVPAPRGLRGSGGLARQGRGTLLAAPSIRGGCGAGHKHH